jgi:hypothetical protein
MSIYGSAYMEGKREAHSKMVQMVLPGANEEAAIWQPPNSRVHASFMCGLEIR